MGQQLTLRSHNDDYIPVGTYAGGQASAGYVQGDGVPIMWQATDSAVLERATATAGTTPISPKVSPTNTSSETGMPSPSPGGLSTGAKVGLGVGISVAAIILLLLGFFLGKRRRERQQTSNDSNVHYSGNDTDYGKMPATQGYELSGQGRYHEMQTHPARTADPQELPSVAH